MITKAGFEIARIADCPWQKRVRFDGRESRFVMYQDDLENGLRMSIVEYPVGAVEPRHVHPGTHATTVVKGRAIIDGLTLGPLDVILGPSFEPHGPLEYPEGCTLFSCFQGSNDHSEVRSLGTEKRYRLVQAAAIAWENFPQENREAKTLVDHGAGPLLLRAQRFAPGAMVERHVHPYMQAALIVEGNAVVDGETFDVWDFIYQPKGVAHGPIAFPNGATLLVVAMR